MHQQPGKDRGKIGGGMPHGRPPPRRSSSAVPALPRRRNLPRGEGLARSPSFGQGSRSAARREGGPGAWSQLKPSPRGRFCTGIRFAVHQQPGKDRGKIGGGMPHGRPPAPPPQLCRPCPAPETFPAGKVSESRGRGWGQGGRQMRPRRDRSWGQRCSVARQPIPAPERAPPEAGRPSDGPVAPFNRSEQGVAPRLSFQSAPIRPRPGLSSLSPLHIPSP